MIANYYLSTNQLKYLFTNNLIYKAATDSYSVLDKYYCICYLFIYVCNIDIFNENFLNFLPWMRIFGVNISIQNIAVKHT